LQQTFGLSDYLAGVLDSNKSVREYFETSAGEAEKFGLSEAEVGKELANCITVDFQGHLNKLAHAPHLTPVTTPGSGPVPGPQWISPVNLMELVAKKMAGEISGPTYKSLLEKMLGTRKTAAELIKAEGLAQVADEGIIEKIIDDVLAKNVAQVGQFKEGKQQVLGFLVGQVMKASHGKANPGTVNELLKKKLK
jgi:aspartyl-tRNA(Asn)/glutamyl-tRNA(Gln) amidotransferase subunit B